MPDPDRFGEALEAVTTEIPKREQAAQEAPRALRDDHCTRPRQSLQSCREVRRLADHGFLLSGALADEMADDNEPRGNPDTSSERPADRRIEFCHSAGYGKTGSHGPLALVLMRAWPSK